MSGVASTALSTKLLPRAGAWEPKGQKHTRKIRPARRSEKKSLFLPPRQRPSFPLTSPSRKNSPTATNINNDDVFQTNQRRNQPLLLSSETYWRIFGYPRIAPNSLSSRRKTPLSQGEIARYSPAAHPPLTPPKAIEKHSGKNLVFAHRRKALDDESAHFWSDTRYSLASAVLSPLYHVVS